MPMTMSLWALIQPLPWRKSQNSAHSTEPDQNAIRLLGMELERERTRKIITVRMKNKINESVEKFSQATKNPAMYRCLSRVTWSMMLTSLYRICSLCIALYYADCWLSHLA